MATKRPTVVGVIPARYASSRFPGKALADVAGNPLGFLINTDTDSNVLGGIRLADGRSVYVYGTFKNDGNIDEITGAVLRDTDGSEAGVVFENGRPVSAYGFDGTTVDPLSVRFGPAEAEVRTVGGGRSISAHVEDANEDGLADLVVQFNKGDIGLACGDTSLTLTGVTDGGVYVLGSDAIRTTPQDQ